MQEDDRDPVDKPWVEIPRSVVTTSIVRELLGTLADAALAAIPEPSLRPFDDALAAMEAGWAAADVNFQRIVREGGAGDDYLGEGGSEPDADVTEEEEE